VEVRDVAARHLAQLREKLAELQALERSMEAFVRSCDTACAGGATVDCLVLEEIGRVGAAGSCMAATQTSTCCGGPASSD
jgi:hypothetical protein